jgi:hypothetical protein
MLRFLLRGAREFVPNVGRASCNILALRLKNANFLHHAALLAKRLSFFTPSKARPGNAKFLGFPRARDLKAFGRAQADS